MTEMPHAVRVTRVVPECRNTKTIFFDTAVKADPGQFVMVWLPGIDEKPFSISYIGKELGITVQERGTFSRELLKASEGDLLGVRGPYGKGFSIKGIESACIVGGGCGCAPLAPLAELLAQKPAEATGAKTGHAKPVAIIGAKTNLDLLFTKRYSKSSELHATTDDGSAGEKGFTTQVLEKMLKERKFDIVYTCGPEKMMRAVFELCEKHKVQCEASLERYMSCGFGICGQCACGDKLVCKDGPVFGSAELREMGEFGKTARLKSGRLVGIEEYVACDFSHGSCDRL